MCGTPAPAPGEVVLGPRPVEGRASAQPSRGLAASVKQLVRRPLFVAAALLMVAGGLFLLRARSGNTPDMMSPVPAIAATTPDPTPPVAATAEKVDDPPKPVSQQPTLPGTPAATPISIADDPAELWKQVRKGNADAEVTLAKLYLDGKGVTRNCEQAHLLLVAAAKKRDRAAGQVLTSLYPLRCP